MNLKTKPSALLQEIQFLTADQLRDACELGVKKPSKRAIAARTYAASLKLKTYLVPAIVHGSFGCELEVEATSIKEAKAKVRAGKGVMPDGDGYDWDRWNESKTTIGGWDKVEVVT